MSCKQPQGDMHYNCTVIASGTIEIFDYGQVSYAHGLELQDAFVHQVQRGERFGALILLEHGPVITLGRGADEEHILRSREWLSSHGVGLYSTGRGGDVTYHGPGQLVGYPIINIKEREPDLHAYMRSLEEVLIRTLLSFGLQANRQTHLTGVWVENRKIAAIGIRVQKWVTSHGFALNVDPALDEFNMIVPCGLHGKEVTSMARELGSAPDMDLVKKCLCQEFADVFRMDIAQASG